MNHIGSLFKRFRQQPINRAGYKRIDWREIAHITILNRADRDGFSRDGAAEEMAKAAEKVLAAGGNCSQAVDAVEAAYKAALTYSSPHEHPCDEWSWRDVMKAAA